MKASTKLPVPSEAQIQGACLQAAALLAVPLHPTDAGAHRRASRGLRGGSGLPTGWPDASGFLPGTRTRLAVPIFAEFKRPGKKPTPAQAACLQRLREQGCYADWFDSVDTFVTWLQTLLLFRGES